MYNKSGDRISIPLPPDEESYVGRECPQCHNYFKVTYGTGLKGSVDFYCPYCGHHAHQTQFATQAQWEYAKSIAEGYINNEIHNMFKDLQRKHPPGRKSGFSVKAGRKPNVPVQHYQERQLETKVVCSNCTLKYAVYGVFAYCPDCGTHNSHQILTKNLELAKKEVDLSATVEGEMAEYLIGDALENVVSAFDGFGREVCRVNAHLSHDPLQAQEIRFQNLSGALKNIQKYFGFDMMAGISSVEWDTTNRCFQKRHLLAHNMGVIDDAYVEKANDSTAIKGRKVSVQSREVDDLIVSIEKLGAYIVAQMQSLAGKAQP